MATEPGAAPTDDAPRPAVDWDLATRRARQLARPGPTVHPAEARDLVAELRGSARAAPAHVGAVTGLLEPALQAGAGPVYVLDRPRWVEANLTMFRSLIGDVLPTPTSAWGARATAMELAAVLGLLSTRVLGQYDPYSITSAGTGRLVLVAPTILSIQTELGLRRRDFGLWVCLHEQTHALQFAAAPWLADHLRTTMRELLGTLTETGDGADRLEQFVRALPQVLRGDRRDATSSSLLDTVLTEPERDLLAETMATMSLLEGHADVVMDEVGPQVVPTVRTIRRAFERRRSGTSPMDVLVRRLLGLDAKLAQYRNGARFVRSVVDQVGHDGFNAVWSGPEHLPRAAELADPQAWVRRVHG
ncbi:MAG TPA: zinc-dependent metalloprotease [Candidatus Ruania gallistercoris]|uniref:Zinc-dependent metalloprotease n=1 Tax=Candidatus Ruania gallistercoris TaxID=2838746 RepID=A0A9D2EDQ1_9MICO|nr:zinc-dependent metalloprotease [Candidatus Ruania gallistercoris]